jgi:hypothetical protein
MYYEINQSYTTAFGGRLEKQRQHVLGIEASSMLERKTGLDHSTHEASHLVLTW